MKRKNLFQDSKKGYISLIIMFILLLFFSAIFSIIGLSIYSELNTDIQNDDDISSNVKDISNINYVRYPLVMDSFFLSLFVLGTIVILIIAWYSYDNQIMLFILIILLLILIGVGALLSNVFIEFISSDEMITHANNFPFTIHILNNYVKYILGLIFACLITLYVRYKN